MLNHWALKKIWCLLSTGYFFNFLKMSCLKRLYLENVGLKKLYFEKVWFQNGSSYCFPLGRERERAHKEPWRSNSPYYVDC